MTARSGRTCQPPSQSRGGPIAWAGAPFPRRARVDLGVLQSVAEQRHLKAQGFGRTLSAAEVIPEGSEGKQPLCSRRTVTTCAPNTPRAWPNFGDNHADGEAQRVNDPWRCRCEARSELVGKAVILTDGKAGTVDGVWLDELHGLRISIRGHDGKWPVSTIKFVQS